MTEQSFGAGSKPAGSSGNNLGDALTASEFGASVTRGTQELSLADFQKRNSPNTGIIVKPVSDWYSTADIRSIKENYPGSRGPKHTIFSSK